MPDQNDIDRVWDIIEKKQHRHADDAVRGRPAGAAGGRAAHRAAGAIYFVTDARGHKDDEIAARPDVCFVVVVPADNVYLSITGRATVARDPAKAGEIWKKTDDVWWKGGPDDPNARVLRIEPVTAELWDGPSSSLVAVYEFAKARITGEKPFLGENRKKTVPMG